MLSIKTLGTFSVSAGETVLSENIARSKKTWKIFKYLVTNRHKMVPIETLIETLWPDTEPENPEKSLFTLISRLRKQLSAEGGTNQYILFQHDSYQWNPDVEAELDVAEFEKLYALAGAAETDEEKLPCLQRAIEIYTGDYLNESSYEPWLLPVTNYYKRLYVSCVLDLTELYARASMFDEIINLCNRAVQIEPYEETIQGRLIQALGINGEVISAKRQYSHFSDLIKKEFGAKPSEEFRSLCQGIWPVEGEQFEISDIKRKLDEGGGRRGVFFCTADIFDQIYQLDMRSDERMKFPVFLGLITLNFKSGNPDNKSARAAMLALRHCITRTLRQGDVVSQYSKNQFVLLLSAYLPKNAEAALVRVCRLFRIEYSGEACDLDINISQVGGAG